MDSSLRNQTLIGPGTIRETELIRKLPRVLMMTQTSVTSLGNLISHSSFYQSFTKKNVFKKFHKIFTEASNQTQQCVKRETPQSHVRLPQGGNAHFTLGKQSGEFTVSTTKAQES